MNNFRYDINGLRAWAVLAVIFYHFNLFGFTGGFSGVDVFFVISGFLMTKIIVEGLTQSENNFSLLEFYLLRARRIIPPLFILCVALSVFGYYSLISTEYHQLSKHILKALTFRSNDTFFRESGYFDTAANTKWLLHTWSLSLEWQFYLILPIVLSLAYAINPKRNTAKYVLLFCMILSFVYSVLITKRRPEYSFYLLPTRAWEMLMGGCVYLYLDQLSIKKTVSRILELLGFALLMGAFFILTKKNVWPGWWAMVPVFGASLILTAKNNTSFLSNNPLFQYIGSISYSWYLWHWPIYVYVVRYQLEGSKKNLLLALAVSWIFAHISYRFIEVPSRKLLRHQSKAISFSLILMPVLAFMIFPWYVKLHQGLVTPLSIQLVKITNESLDKNPRESECQVLNRADPTKPSECTYGGKKLGVILVGDSHASAIALALQKALPDKNLHVLDWSISSCPASLKYKGDSELYTRCVISNAVFLEKNKHLPKDVPLLMVNYSNRVDRMEFACLLAKERPVYLLKPTPQFFANVPTIMAQNIMRKKWQYRLKTSITENYNQYEKEHLIQLDETVKKCGVKLLETLPYFCKNGYCYGDKDGIPLYYDDNHLSLYGADLLIPEFKKIFLHTA